METKFYPKCMYTWSCNKILTIDANIWLGFSPCFLVKEKRLSRLPTKHILESSSHIYNEFKTIRNHKSQNSWLFPLHTISWILIGIKRSASMENLKFPPPVNVIINPRNKPRWPYFNILLPDTKALHPVMYSIKNL